MEAPKAWVAEGDASGVANAIPVGAGILAGGGGGIPPKIVTANAWNAVSMAGAATGCARADATAVSRAAVAATTVMDRGTTPAAYAPMASAQAVAHSPTGKGGSLKNANRSASNPDLSTDIRTAL